MTGDLKLTIMVVDECTEVTKKFMRDMAWLLGDASKAGYYIANRRGRKFLVPMPYDKRGQKRRAFRKEF